MSGFLDDMPNGFGFRVKKNKPETPDTIIFYKLRCPNPECSSEDVPVYTTKVTDGVRIRYHKCAKCGETFKSIEQ